MNKESINIRVVANGFIATARPTENCFAVCDEHTHVFASARALGDWVAQFYGANDDTRPVGFGNPADPEHNPDALSPKQVGVEDGWRLLRKSEIKERCDHPAVEMWSQGKWLDGPWCGVSVCATYRTKLTPEELAKLP